MGFYIRKSISAGPFRFNLSGSGVGMSVGVKGFRVGTGPRGNYVHMGRGGLYYRASLGGGRSPRPAPSMSYTPSASSPYGTTTVETGNVSEMVLSNGSDLLQQINDKMSSLRSWPWVLLLGGALSLFVSSAPGEHHPGLALLFLTVVAAAFAARWDQTRRAVVVMYDLADDVAERFRAFCVSFDTVGGASRIWNIDTAAATADWKRNAGAGQLITRKAASFLDAAPSVLKTNVPIPCIRGGRQTLHFLPDTVLVIEGGKAGALSYEQFDVQWNTTIFIEEEGVPPDSQVVGHTWRFVNKNGGPDRRFNNNRQIPRVEYQQMGMQGGGGLRKLLQLSKVESRASFDAALMGLRQMTKTLALEGKGELTKVALTEDMPPETGRRTVWTGTGIAVALAVALGLYFLPAMPDVSGQTPSPDASSETAQPVVIDASAPQPAPQSRAEDPLVDQAYRGAGNSGSYESDAMRVTTDFFRDLERSDGDAAVQFVSIERRERGPLSAASLTAKFSNLQEPLHLDDVSPVGGNRVRALYSYMPASGLHCVGRALVTITNETSEYLIQSLRTRESCR